MIACVRLPHLALLAAQRQDASLRGGPLILGESPLGTVIAASEEARRRGAVPGMTIKHAEQCCPEAIVQPVDETATARLRTLLLSTLYSLTPEVMAAVDGYAFLDLRGLRLLWPDSRLLAHELDARIESSLSVRPALGIAETVFTSRLAADRALPGAPRIVEDAAAFLEPLPIECLPMDEDQRSYLDLLGLRTLGELRRIPRPAFRRQFGIKAVELHDLACGIDARTVATWRPPARIEESAPLEPPLEDTEALQFVVRSLIDRIAEALKAGGLGAREIVIRLDLEGAPRLREAVRYPYPLTTGADLFDRVRGRLLRMQPSAPVERITLGVRQVEPAYVRQPGLLLRRDGFQETLADAIGRLQEETRPELIQRIAIDQSAPPVPDRRVRLAAVATP
jgi:nucleotidyltransferase/DNA polymerase involved in DNA repair